MPKIEVTTMVYTDARDKDTAFLSGPPPTAARLHLVIGGA
jgi:hypothetical protein